MRAPPSVAVIIPARDAAATLPDTLDALAAQTFSDPFEVIVIDDGSSDATAEIAGDCEVVGRVFHLGGSGPATARNAGVHATAAERLAFLDADCRATREWLASGIAALDSADLVVGETRPRPDRACGPYDRTLWVEGCSPLFEAANLFVRRSLFERLGGFESWLGPRDGKELGEDVWFGWRAVRAGARVAGCPAALVHHEVYPRRAVAFAGERWRLRFFPAMARRIPELRRAAFHRRYFLTPRQLRFDAAAAGLLLAVGLRRPLAAAAAIPYARLVARELRGPGGAGAATARIAADGVALAALAVGSARSRSLLI